MLGPYRGLMLAPEARLTLRLRLFVLFGGLLALLVAAQAWLVRSLTRELSEELSKLAASVGSQVVRVVTKGEPPGEPPAVVSPGVTRSFVFAVPPPPPAPEGAPAATGERIEVHKELRWEETEIEPAQTGPASEPTPGRIVTTVEVRTDAEGRVVRRTRTEGTKGPTRFLVVTGPHVAARIPIPEAGVARAVERFRNRLLLGSLGLCALGLAAAGFAAHRVSAPLRKLSSAARSVGEGRFGEQVGASATGEVGEAIQAFDRMSARLQELEREAVAAREREHLGELGDVGRGLAHALRNPLHALGLAVDELASRAGEEGEEIAASARRQIRSVDRSIRSFLALASDGGAPERVDLRGLAEEVALSAAQDARGRVRVTVESPEGDCHLVGIPAELASAVQALVVNAIEASPDGGAVVVRVSPREGDAVTLSVEDEGPGLPEEVRGRLFTPHVTTKPTGSGMGLFLARRIATTRYSGDLALAERERGCRATLTLRDRSGADA